MSNIKKEKRIRRHKRIRSKINGTLERPRLSVFKSNRFFYAQIINDDTGSTIVSADSKNAEGKTFTEKAIATGKKLAELAKAKKIETVVFDRGGFIFTGAISKFADAAREAGLKF